MSEGDASGGGTAGGVGGDDDAVWRDLIARYEMSVDADSTSVPWPDREDLRDDPASGDTADDAEGSAGGGGAEDGPEASSGGSEKSATGTASGDGGSAASNGGHTNTPGNGDRGAAGSDDPAPGTEAPETRRGQAPGAGRTRVIRPATPPPASPPAPPEASAGLRSSASPARAGDGEPRSEDDTGEHYVPPPPPPMPHLDPVAKGAWTALFGGPAYLFVSTLIGWKAPSWAALLAVAAFVGGFAVIVLRLGDKPSRGDGPDNGAVL